MIPWACNHCVIGVLREVHAFAGTSRGSVASRAKSQAAAGRLLLLDRQAAVMSYSPRFSYPVTRRALRKRRLLLDNIENDLQTAATVDGVAA
jgi:hypothetical protein